MNLIVILIFVVLNEAIIEYFIGNIKSLRIYIPLLSLATAILLAFGYQVSLFHIFLGTEVINPFFDFLLSAFVVARLSNFLNDLAQKYLGSK
ncbi:MAG: hypothetical protein ACD_32C00147G0002 [uncultured bacterium]|uniref:Uncharacterized protein n=1 Tax=Candidatus Daviesbacteria bacterium GW2011_GWC2_40_12 TaxID=1618431 RepID=A0A0G0QVC2_9BACT|nr:MAG: hypothetical protein ACD_32C00147G0002 [uncultured bacterium]KKR15805.1 MAG: hypothetical protein UT45_C0013G0003 [Candidatus Daviesbacteria bacterium GW2011_GWA2_39_33]KKR24614.1 MAG: hypothetical protein UT54_C0016G0016 [Candidatus Daviesbacteria bacterium GW2011_GWB1_39_5]KKR41306.1 MAG: hypothetical protein UT77_C0014G0003 [Candidatus Daviesbacteria bacterium GW2011_GWC2_40_12]OGE21005.1 MAG: hypothetical protein A2778_05075 [Candidatus Daviesbacteria bacterium RIFCSPHIGHO2_01_FULL_